MKVGDYVRNKYGIAKVIDIENNNGIDILVFDKPICFLVNKETGEIKDDRLLNRLAIIDGVDVNKIKSSPNIIDLIEVGDYVDGCPVLYINYDLDKDEDIVESITISNPFQETKDILYEKDIKSIVTKECFESMEYKVGE